jgi:hypothetical protein
MPPDEVAAEIVERLETALDRFRKLARRFAEADMSEVTPANAPALSDDRAKSFRLKRET